MAEDTDAARRSVHQDRPREGGLRGPGAPRPLLLLALVLGLAVAAVCLDAADSGGGSLLDSVGPLHGEWLLILLVVGVGGWYLTAKYYGRQNERPMGTPHEGRLVTLTVTALVLTILGTAVTLAMVGMGTTDQPPPVAPATPPVMPSIKPQPLPPVDPGGASRVHVPHPISLPFLLTTLLVLAVLALLVAAVIVARRYLGSRSAPPPELVGTLEAPADEEALSAAVSAGRLALHGEDVRAAVIACYAAMEDSLARSGLGRRASDSPADLLQRAGAAGLLVGLAPQELAALFREARYSSHPMTQAELVRARNALDDISRLLAEREAAAEALKAAEGLKAAATANGEPVR
ncbi:DUF4129 domain-containing protein [Streptacidiphilus sp. PAMC 29251]